MVNRKDIARRHAPTPALVPAPGRGRSAAMAIRIDRHPFDG
jgi:hypothetical protein